jgi:hypothetical protein
VNELELIASLRDEVPLVATARIEDAVLREIAAARGHTRGGSRWQWSPRPGHIPSARPARRRALRPVIAGALACAVGAGAYGGVLLFGSGPAGQRGVTTATWSGRPTAPWPSTAHPSYGTAKTEAQLVADVTRAAAAFPGRAPKPKQWVVVKTEYAGSSGGEGGYLFGPADKRDVSLTWYRGDGCAVASVPPVPATTTPSSTVTGKLRIDTSNYVGIGCRGSTLGGWRSVSYPYLDSLPVKPAALEHIIARNYGPVSAASRPQAIFQSIYLLLDAGEMQGVVVPPRLAASMYRVLQQLPGMHFERTTDLAGRHGLGFYLVLEGYYKLELVIDPTTYAYMGSKEVVIRDHAMVGTDGTRYVKKGHVLGWAALLGQAIVDKPGQLPG